MQKKIKHPCFLLLLMFFIGIPIMNAASSSSNDFTNYKKPWFSIEFETTPIGVDIRLNDAPVFNIDNTGFMTLEIPVNEYIINGDNEIKITTHPLFDDNEDQLESYSDSASIKIAFYVREEDEPYTKRTLINHVTIKPKNAYLDASKKSVAILKYGDNSSQFLQPSITDGEVLNFPSVGVYKKQVVTSWVIKNITTPLSKWSWQDGLEITDNEENYISLLKVYKKLHEKYDSKDVNSIKETAKLRSSELAIAYYLGDEQAGFEYSAMTKHINHNEVKLHQELFMDYMKFDILANGKLARIINRGRTHPIVFANYDTEQVYSYQFMWYLNKNKEWILIR